MAPDAFPLVRRVGRLYVLVLPFCIAVRLWRRRDAEVILFHSYCGWVFSLFKRRRKMITSFHGLEPFYYDELRTVERAAGRDLSLRFRVMFGWIMPRLLRLTCRRSDRVICQTREEEQYLLDHGWTTRGKLTRLGSGVSQMFFVEDRAYAPRARRVLLVAQWQERKGVRYLIEAWTTLVRAGLDLELVCAGTRHPDAHVLGAFPEDVRSRVRNIAEIAHDALPAVYRHADIFVHPSVMEGSSQAQVEAMASALPMVVTATAPAIDLLKDGEGFLLVPKRDAASLAQAIRTLIDDPELRARLGRTAQQAARGATMEITNDTYIALFRALATSA